MSKNGAFKGFQNVASYSTANGRWGIKQAYDGLSSGPWPQLTDIEYVVVAGGGGGGGADNETEGGGGGGAGGFRFGNIRTFLGGGITVTVGAGGVGQSRTGTDPIRGTKGSASVLESVTSTGGGGGDIPRSGVGPNIDGGSGGGATFRNTRAGYGNTPSVTPTQGYDGRRSTVASNNGGGGGGAGGVGAGAIYLPGIGVESSLSGSAVTYSTGGQGGRGISSTGYVAGAANTGDGGAGGYAANEAAGGAQFFRGGRNGGSGIVIVKYPSSFPALSIGAGLTADTPIVSGGYRTYVFTAGTGIISF